MILLEEHLWGTASAIQQAFVWLIIEKKYIISTSITASIWKNISKNISENEENLQKGLWSVYKFWSVNYKS